MDVAIAGVEHVGNAELILGTNPLDRAEDVRQLGAWHDAVLRAITRRQPTHGSKGLLAALPEQESLRITGGAADFARLVLPGDGRDALCVGIETSLQPIDLHDQDSPRVQRETKMERRLDRLEDQLIEQF